ncbi:TnsD family Tn7-like transposition protein [Cupriavidus metallidurans]|uniref:TnsD family Tn7-like transposition protein n=1 Tax=Cupriavidus metallidurans TaxID=119219 RepID=UPI001BFC2025|nr:TnsD family Tn7-like transposition protein [Cupriavidus metallidurans]QWC88822.1 hypothetical protein KB891_01035 [Cupriavidus metallidurans]
MLDEGTSSARENSRLYARAASQLLRKNPLGDFRGNMLAQLVALGYAEEGHGWKGMRFAADWTALSKEGFEDVRLSAIAACDGFPYALMRAIIRTERPMHPAWLVLLSWFLLREAGAYAFVPRPNGEDVHKRPKRTLGATKREPTQGQIDVHRSQWLRHLAAHANATRTELRRGLRSVWMWLYRHDGEWLEQNQPAPARRYVPKNCRQPIGSVLAARVDASQIDERDVRGMPHLQTMYQNRIRYGLNDYAYSRLLRENPALANACVARQQLVGLRADHLRGVSGVHVENYSLSTKSRFLSLRPGTVELAAQTTIQTEGKVSVTAGPHLFTNNEHHAGRKLGWLFGAASLDGIKDIADAGMAVPIRHQRNNEAVREVRWQR